jgi:D-3-phosphoglycerate dehydrogenase / 2-oxoglutarate reductase
VTVRILVADRMSTDFLDALTAAGHDWTAEPALAGEALAAGLDGIEILVVRGTEVDARAFDAASALRLVVRAGSGTNTIDCQAATDRGVLVANVPGRNAIAVAELTMALLLAVDRAIPDNTAELRAGRWEKVRFSQSGRGLFGRRLGIVGLGSIGLEVALRAKAFGMRLAALPSSSRRPETAAWLDELGVELAGSLVELASAVDVLTLHVPLTSATKGLVDRAVLDALAPGILVNTSRGAVVCEDALLAHLDAGTLSAGLDVFPDEPKAGSSAWDSPLARHPRVVGTHHIGASTEQAQLAVAAGALDVIAAFTRGELLHVVNAPGPS